MLPESRPGPLGALHGLLHRNGADLGLGLRGQGPITSAFRGPGARGRQHSCNWKPWLVAAGQRRRAPDTASGLERAGGNGIGLQSEWPSGTT